MRLFQQKEWALLWPYYLTCFLMGAITFTWPFFVIYYQSRGLTLTQMAFMWGLMSVAKVFLEIPTGVIADVFGRKVSVFLGYFGMSVGWLLIPLTTTYPSLILALLLIATFQTFVSGAIDAWVYDLLVHERQKQLYKKIQAKIALIYLSGAIIGPLIGAWLATQTTLGNLFLIEGALGILISFIILFMREHFTRKKARLTQHARALITTTKTGLHYAATHPQLRLLFLITGCFAALAGFTQDLGTQPVLTLLGMPVPALGIYSALFAAFAALAPTLGLALGRYVTERTVYLFTTAIAIASVALIKLVPAGGYLAAGTLLILVAVAAGAQNPLFMARVNTLIPRKTRATILSTQSMINNAAYVAVILIGGKLIDTYGAQTSIALASILLVPALIAFTRIKTSAS